MLQFTDLVHLLRGKFCIAAVIKLHFHTVVGEHTENLSWGKAEHITWMKTNDMVIWLKVEKIKFISVIAKYV